MDPTYRIKLQDQSRKNSKNNTGLKTPYYTNMSNSMRKGRSRTYLSKIKTTSKNKVTQLLY
jgi:hypothetical protein